MININMGKIENFISIEREYDELLNQIDSACRQFCSEKINRCYEGWDFNDRKTLIIISYSYTKHGETEYGSEYVSFKEIERIISENEPKIKQIEND